MGYGALRHLTAKSACRWLPRTAASSPKSSITRGVEVAQILPALGFIHHQVGSLAESPQGLATCPDSGPWTLGSFRTLLELDDISTIFASVPFALFIASADGDWQ